MTFITRWFKIFREEFRLFLFMVGLMLIIRCSHALLSNFTETTFLKRFGIEYLPLVYIGNALTSFVVLNLTAGLMFRFTSDRLLRIALVICGASIAGMYFLIPLGIDYLYPLFYFLNVQYGVLLGLLFWNLANQLFDTRQAKRIFPLLAAGGILGSALGGFFTLVLGEWMRIDSLLLAYALLVWTGAAVSAAMYAPPPPQTSQPGDPQKEQWNVKAQLSRIKEIVRFSRLMAALILITFLPNVVIPLLNYQFFYVSDQFYGSEKHLITFLAYLKGATYSMTFLILLFIGRYYRRWGLPTALLFHPLNYVAIFISLLLRFELVVAVYARLSTSILRNAFNNPARAALIGLFPPRFREMIRPFLRGTVVRAGALLGSFILLYSQAVMHPRYLSLLAAALGIIWLGTVFWLKKTYASMILELLAYDRQDIDADAVEQKALADTRPACRRPADLKNEQRRVPPPIWKRLKSAYIYASLWIAVKRSAEGGAGERLLSHLDKRRRRLVKEIIRKIGQNCGNSEMQIIQRALRSDKPHKRAGGIEALDYALEHSFSELLIPIVEMRDSHRIVQSARQRFGLPDYGAGSEQLVKHLLTDAGMPTVLLTLRWLIRQPLGLKSAAAEVTDLTHSNNPLIRRLAKRLASRQEGES